LLEQLIHNGIIVPDPPPYRALTIRVRGQTWTLTHKQEEMAWAWAKKLGTDYVEDPVFVANFMQDFSAELAKGSATGERPPADLTLDALNINDIDFSVLVRLLEAERAVKANLTAEEKKAQAAQRKAVREELKERYGHAQVNGKRVELGNYMSEPSGIFMGRGEHPLRGRWKEGATQADVTLNLSPDAPRPPGDWAEIVWQPESLWVARWLDKLSDKLKYVWLSDNSSLKQQREEAKFDKAIALHEQIETVRAHIQDGMHDKRPRRRMIATACYLIDALCLRVGDEKEADEADTVGATTLRPEHVTLLPDGLAEFKFLGKDSVPWHKELVLPPLVYDTLETLIREARPSSSAGNGDESHPTRDLPQIFPDIGSRNINTFLSRAQKGLSAKVFRTHHATHAVQESLQAAGVRASSPEYCKWQAVAAANLEAAILCNHTKKDTGNWEARRQRYEERIAKAQERLERYRGQLADRKEALQVLQVEAASKRAIAQARLDKVDAQEASAQASQLDKAQANLQRTVERYEKRLARARQMLKDAEARVQRTRDAIGSIEAQMNLADHKRTWNLGTSLKSYIDPRVYVRWGERVGYDVLEKYYPTTLRRKFAWAQSDEDEPDEDED